MGTAKGSHRAVLQLPPPKDDFEAFLQGQQRRLLHRFAHALARMRYRWRQQQGVGRVEVTTIGTVRGYTGRSRPELEE